MTTTQEKMQDALDTLESLVNSFRKELANGETAINLLHEVSAFSGAANDLTEALVAVAKQGHTWAEIGNALGTSRQAAHQRFVP